MAKPMNRDKLRQKAFSLIGDSIKYERRLSFAKAQRCLEKALALYREADGDRSAPVSECRFRLNALAVRQRRHLKRVPSKGSQS
jgi:hypothetical protein